MTARGKGGREAVEGEVEEEEFEEVEEVEEVEEEVVFYEEEEVKVVEDRCHRMRCILTA